VFSVKNADGKAMLVIDYISPDQTECAEGSVELADSTENAKEFMVLRIKTGKEETVLSNGTKLVTSDSRFSLYFDVFRKIYRRIEI
jgi:hypothetical protein